MSLCPGRKGRGFSGYHDRDLPTDLDAIKRAGVTTIVPLIEHFEFGMLKISPYFTEAALRDIYVDWHPVKDGGVPSNVESYRKLIARIEARILAGEKILVHCKAGHGRTGTACAALLMTMKGLHPAEAIAECRRARKDTVDFGRQEAFLYDFAGVPRPQHLVNATSWADTEHAHAGAGKW
jgi:ADP-ribosyl-[dinitrogen reductase] hydrolase